MPTAAFRWCTESGDGKCAVPAISGCANVFSSNTAADAANTDLDNPSTFGASRENLSASCDTIFRSAFD